MTTETTSPAIHVDFRFFAAARAATSADALPLQLQPHSSIEDALRRVADDLPDEDASAHATAVFRRCSFLVNGVAVTDRVRALADGDRVDVMPPFAGG